MAWMRNRRVSLAVDFRSVLVFGELLGASYVVARAATYFPSKPNAVTLLVVPTYTLPLMISGVPKWPAIPN